MDSVEQRRIVEALILTSPEPISPARLAEIVPGCTPALAKDRVNELNTEYQEQDRSFEIWEVAGGYQIRTRAEFSGYLQQLRKERPLRLSRAALETLSVVAYKQPATRAEVEAVRGVDSGAVLRSLLERRLVRIAGHREVPGRPILYATSRRFLEVFGLESLGKLPALRELEDLARDQGVKLPGEAGEEHSALQEAMGDEPSLQAGAVDSVTQPHGAEADEADEAATFSDSEPDPSLEEEQQA